tara:strand:- start:1858 stop:3201 length:1344 start_codon:yes stop_codon:yes gene_type:complete
MGFITSPGGLSGLSSSVSNAAEIRSEKVKQGIDSLDEPIDQGLEDLDNFEKNEESKEKLVKKLMSELRTANRGLVLSEVEKIIPEFDSLDAVDKVTPTLYKEILGNIRWSTATLDKNSSRGYSTKVLDPRIMALKEGDTSSFGRKLTGGSTTASENIKYAGRDKGMTFDQTQEALAIRDAESGISTNVMSSGVKTDHLGRKPGDTGYNASTAVLRSTEFAFSNIPASMGDRVYTTNRQFGYTNKTADRRAANQFSEDRLLTYFGFIPQRTIDGTLAPPTRRNKTGEAEDAAFAATIAGDVRSTANAIIDQSGEISGSLLTKITDDAYNTFYDLMETHSSAWVAKSNAAKQQYAKDNSLNNAQISRLENFSTAFIRNTKSTSGNLVGGRAITSNMYTGREKDYATDGSRAVRQRVGLVTGAGGEITVFFNNGDFEKGQPTDSNIAPYL